jgi:hypothetical protein
MKKALLITPFPPNQGGGAVNVKSAIPYFKNVEVEWVYLNHKDLKLEGYTHLGNMLMGGSIGKDLKNSLLLWLGIKTKAFQQILDKIRAIKTDIYWVVGYNEGILIARELALTTNIPVHISLHDDIPYGVLGRSNRYRWLAGIAQQRNTEALRAARSVDVTSDAMRDYYQRTIGVDTVVFHPYVPKLPTVTPVSFDAKSLTVGHVGNLYTLNELRLFCQALIQYGQTKGIKVQLILVGLARQLTSIVEEFPQLILDIGHLPEPEAIAHLQGCNFLYTMYPFAPKAAIFRQTSFPTKLTTCVQSQRPIFAHTPEDSTLAGMVTEYKLGIYCNSLQISEITQAIEKIHHYEVNSNAFENAHKCLYEIHNVILLENCLRGD